MSVGKRPAMFYAAFHVSIADRWGCGDRDLHERALDHLVDDNTSDPEIVTDGGVDVSKLPGKPRQGGDGLPVVPFGARDRNQRLHLFTCCGCGHRWLGLPDHHAECLCGGSIVVHQFTVDEYQRIKEFGDVREREIVTDGGTDVDPVICDRLRRIYRRGPVIEEVAGLFGFDVDDTRVHLLGDCECRNRVRPITTLGGRL